MKIFNFRNNSNLLNNSNVYVYYVVFSIICIVFGFLVGYSAYIAIAVIGACGILLFISKEPLIVLILLILLSPYAGTIYLRENMFDIPGSKPILVLGFLTALVSLINFQAASKMPKYAYYFSVAIITIFTISIFRSLTHLDVFNKNFVEMGQNTFTTFGYILSAYVKELIFFLPFIIIIKYAKTERHLNIIMDIIFITILLFSIHLLYERSQFIKNGMNSTDGTGITEYYSDIYGLHRNSLALFYVCGLPYAFRRFFLGKKMINILFILIILTGISFLFSRTGYGAAIFALIYYLIISKRKKYLPIVIIIASICLIYLASTAIIQRATTGFNEKDTYKISAGRIDQIWIPLIEENLNHNKKFLFGDGRYAILASDSLNEGKIAFVGHPHNMYLETLLDAGVISLIIIITFFYVITRKAYITLKNTDDIQMKENLYACIVSILSFLLSGMTGRSFFPMNENILIWVVLGCTIASCQLINNKRKELQRAPATQFQG